MATNLRDQVLEVSQDYLGPAAERFIDRQITTHLDKQPGKLDKKDIANLIDWVRVSFALLTGDSRMVDEFVQRLQLVAEGHGSKAIGEQWMPK